jgi:hypothetical protein
MSALTAHLIYDRETGEVVHVHLEACDLSSSTDELIGHADATRRESLAVHSLPAANLPRHGPVSVRDGELRDAEADVAAGGGGGGGGLAEPDTQRRYERRQ